MKINEINAPVQPDTYEASMFIKQAIRAGKYAIKIHNLLSNDQEMESWVAKKIDLATGYISTIGHYIEGQEMTEDEYEPASREHYKKSLAAGYKGSYEDYKKEYGSFPDEFPQKNESVTEDAGEGHMSKSQLYAAAKYCLNIASSVRPGDDIEGWVQTKMNRAVDMLDAVYHYEDYQKLNPYRETLGDVCDQHGAIIQKKIDEILAYETEIDDIETKPGMFNILKRRVNEFEKKMAKEGSRMPSSMIKNKQKLDSMSPAELKNIFQKRADLWNANHKPEDQKTAQQMAADQEFRYGREFAKNKPYSRHFESTELDEGLKDWLQKMAAAGIIIGSIAGFGAVNNAMNNSLPVMQAMNKALDMAKQDSDTKLVSMIKQDIQGAEVRLDSGKDLNHIKYLQDKYSKFMPAGYKKEDQSTDKDYPPHLQDLFKKLRAKQAQDSTVDFKVTDVTPAGYGPKDDEVKEYNLSPFKQKVMNKIAQPSKDYKEKLATLQTIQNDPNTSKDPELKDVLMKRLDKLKTTGESRTVMYTNKLADMMGKKLGESWSTKYKKSINCSNPKGFSQRAHCQGRKKRTK